LDMSYYDNMLAGIMQMMDASSAQNAEQLAGIQDMINQLANQKPSVNFAGSSFVNPGATSFAPAGSFAKQGGTSSFKRRRRIGTSGSGNAATAGVLNAIKSLNI